MNRSLQEKTSSRMAAVQLLYKAYISKETPDAAALLSDYQRFLDENTENPKEANLPQVPAHMGYLKKLLEGALTHAESLEPHVERALTSDWKKERVSPLLLAILRVYSFELSHMENLKTPILISEYVDLAGRFFGDAETGFIHAAANTIAKEIRGLNG